MAFNRLIPRVSYNEDLPDVVGHVAGSPSALSSLLTDTDIDERNEPCVRLRTDNYLVLHQKDIENRIGLDNVRNWIEALNKTSQNSDCYQQALDRLSDRDLFSIVRSRHIQSPAEVSAYSKRILEDAAFLAQARADLLRRNIEAELSKKQSESAPVSQTSGE